MRAWLVDQFGEPSQMRLGEIPVPEPGRGEVRVKVQAAALNFFDLLLVQGKYQAKPGFPFIAGAEAAGVVEAVGPDVESVEPGSRVIALPGFGCFAEQVIVKASRVLAVPDAMPMATAAALPIVYQTSWFGLVDRAKLLAGETLLVHAGASGVGMAAIQIGRSLGARVIATAGSAAKLAFCVQQGAEVALNYSDASWMDEVKRLTGGRGADVIYDPVGGDIFDQSTKCIAPGGRLVVIGFTSGRIPTIAANRILLKNIAVVGAVWGNWTNDHPQYIHETHVYLMDLYAREAIAPVIYREYAMEELPEGLVGLGNRAAMGKSVLRVGG